MFTNPARIAVCILLLFVVAIATYLKVYEVVLELEQKGLVEMLQEQSRIVEKITTDELTQMLLDIRSKYSIIKTKNI